MINEDYVFFFRSISGKEARKVRVSLTSFFDSLTLVTETMKEFDSREPVYSHY